MKNHYYKIFVMGILLGLLSTTALSSLTDGLLAYYPFSGNANDASGNGRHGTVNGATLITDRFGNANSAYFFDKNTQNQYISASDSGFPSGNAARTMACWILCEVHSSIVYGTFIIYGHQTSDNVSQIGFDKRNGKSNLVFTKSGPDWFGPIIEHDRWYHIVYTYDGVINSKFYVNGELKTSGSPFSLNTTLPGTFYIGNDYRLIMQHSGALDEIRIYNRALDATEIQTLYDQESSLATPTGLSASKGTFTDKVRITWNAVADATGYALFRNTSNSSNSLPVFASTTNLSYNDTTALSEINYYYWIKATNLVSSSGFSGSDVGYLDSAATNLAAPTGVSASKGAYTNMVQITWNNVVGALYYEVWRDTSNNTASAYLLTQTTNSMSYNDEEVTAGTTYYYWIKAKNGQSTSAFSNPDSGYTAYVPPTPSGNADLSLISLLFLPATLTTNQNPGAVSVQLINYGPQNLTPLNTRVAIDFYLSKNTIFGDSDDISMGDYTSDQMIGASSYTTVVLPVAGRQGITVPVTVTGGTYYVFARVRHVYPSTLIDPDETNNHVIRNGSITITADTEGDIGYYIINDYDGDEKSDLALYKEETGEWIIMLSGSAYASASFSLGGNDYRPVIADYDGDGKADPAVCNQTTGIWRAMFSGSAYAEQVFMFGGATDIPVPIDYDGDGKADPAIYQQSGNWIMFLSGSGYAEQTMNLGGNGYIPVPADYDGDGISDLAVYRKSTGDWMIKLSSLNYWTTEFRFGGSGAIPIPADYDGDGRTDPATYRESSGEWQIMMSRFSYLPASAVFGGHGYTPVSADYDGDGKADPVIYKESTGEIQILLSGRNYQPMNANVGGPGFEPVGIWERN